MNKSILVAFIHLKSSLISKGDQTKLNIVARNYTSTLSAFKTYILAHPFVIFFKVLRHSDHRNLNPKSKNEMSRFRFEIFCNLCIVQILMDMNTAGALIGCGGKQDLIMVIQVAKVLMETEIGIINGEVMYSSLFPIDMPYFVRIFVIYRKWKEWK